MSRLPRAQLTPDARITPASADALIGKKDDTRLKWNVPREEILRGVETVGGIAKLAKVDRTTVYRARIAPGSMHALQWVRDRRMAMRRPLVGLKNGQLGQNASGQYLRARDPRFYEVMAWLEAFDYEPRKLVAVIDPLLPKVRTSRKRPMPHLQADETRQMTEEDREMFKQAERRGLLVKYHKSGRSIKGLCLRLNLSRMGFWKWRRSLPRAEQDQLSLALRG
jgi:hypothetical protein